MQGEGLIRNGSNALEIDMSISRQHITSVYESIDGTVVVDCRYLNV